VICFDTMTVIWGVQGIAKEGQSHMTARTKQYIKYLDEKNEKIMIPTPALTEYLLHFEPAEQVKQQRIIQENFIVPAFDIRAGVLAAELLGNTELFQKIVAEGDIDKIRVRTDAQIIATAIVNQAEKIISHDPDFIKLAQDRIAVEKVPVIHTQLDMDFE